VPPSPVRLPALGVVLAGRYRLLERIGTGGIGEVYRAADDRMQCTVAIKLLRAGAPHDLEQASRLFDGASTASQIHHQHIVQVHETGLCEFGPFIVMEDLRGENVGRLLARHGRLKKESCFAIIEPVLSALGAAHSIGLIHGDVKPENVVVCQLPDNRVTVKLLDFGAMSSTSTAGQFVGSTEYLSPEQAEGRPMDHRSDLFSACVLLYELLTNSLPFHGPTAAATTYRIANLACPTLEQVGLAHSEALSEVLLRGLQKEPQRRHAHVRELLEALRPLMAGETPASTLLSELLPVGTLLRQESGTMPSSSAVSQRPRSAPMTGPESGARLTSAAPRPSLFPPSSRPDPSQPSSPRERDSLPPVLPARYRGRYRARAIVWQALDEYVRSRRPANLRERILYDIGNEDASDLLLGTLQGIVYCELESITQYIELATMRLFSGDPSWCRAAGREAVEGVLSAALTRSIPPTPNVVITLRRVCRILGPLFDFGEWQVDGQDQVTAAVVSISSMDAVCQGLRLWVVGLIERSLAVVHQGASLTVTRGEGSFMSRLVIEVVTR
jgi:eukaryotic-like serine/threonine-protein kinase